MILSLIGTVVFALLTSASIAGVCWLIVQVSSAHDQIMCEKVSKTDKTFAVLRAIFLGAAAILLFLAAVASAGGILLFAISTLALL